MTRYQLIVIAFLTTTVANSAQAQDVLPLGDDQASHYFDFWEGTWHQVVNGEVDTTRTTFRVRRGVHRAAFVEEWRMVIDSTTIMHATALRAWDKTTQRWRYTWVSDNGLYQVWEGHQVDDDWYLYSEFDIEGDRYLSRQAWLPTGPDRVVRISERSDDGGRTWRLRFREEYQRAR